MPAKKSLSKKKRPAKQETDGGCPEATCSVIEVRINGKLHDCYLEGPEHAVENELRAGGPYQEIRVVKNPRGYNFSFLDDLISPPNA
jgi:hypothetical protein